MKNSEFILQHIQQNWFHIRSTRLGLPFTQQQTSPSKRVQLILYTLGNSNSVTIW